MKDILNSLGLDDTNPGTWLGATSMSSALSLIHISEPTRLESKSRMPS